MELIFSPLLNVNFVYLGRMKPYFFIIIFLLLITETVDAQNRASNRHSKFPVIAYFPGRTSEAFKRIDVERITHIHYAFVNPDSNGNFTYQPFIDSLSTFCREHNLKLLLSIGGGSAPAYYSKLLSTPYRKSFVQALAKLAEQYNVTGIDVDLEGARIDSNYAAFITDLKKALKTNKKIITAAIATAYKDALPDKALKQLDYITIMSYDRTGPWNPAKPGQHSPYQMAVDDIFYWNKTRKLKKKKLYLGLPFYGYSFGPKGAGSMSFQDIMRQFPEKANQDEFILPDSSTLYYNGLTTIREKTKLALKKAGGIMFWQLLQDADGENSLLNAIDDEIKIYGR